MLVVFYMTKTDKYNIYSLFRTSAADKCSEHCLRDILPPVLSQCYDMRHRAHSFVLPQCNSNLYKKSFINYCLFKDV